MDRRQLLQMTGAAIAALGLSPFSIRKQSDRYARVLAQPTSRKLALLVGISQYSLAHSGWQQLPGCVTDVELQKQLLIHRFGFHPDNILTLVNEQATRQGILTAFEEHLIAQARPDDVVVFHYSGHGSRIADPDRDFPDGLNSTFVPIDSPLPLLGSGPVEDITGHTLFLLMAALQSERVAVVLDSCHSGGGKRGTLQVRSREGGSHLQASEAELEYQARWLSRLNLGPEEFIRQRREGVAKGIVVASAKRNQLAADVPFNGFHAGAFTYLMTQYLWQQVGGEPANSAIANLARGIAQASFRQKQVPEFEFMPGSSYDKQPVYFAGPPTPPAEGAITRVSGDLVQFWLGGIDSRLFDAFNRDAVFTVLDAQGEARGEIELTEREGLHGTGKILNAEAAGAIEPGFLLQEKIRGVPTDLTLHVGIDSSIEGESAAAVEALQTIRRVDAIPQFSDREVHYLLGRMTADYHQQLQEEDGDDLPAIDGLGLFAPSLDPIPGSFAQPGESISNGARRLAAKFKSLLAARIAKLVLDVDSSHLNVEVGMALADSSSELLAKVFPVRGLERETDGASTPQQVRDGGDIPLGKRVQFRVTNREPDDLFVTIIAIDSLGDMAAIFPNSWTSSSDITRVAAGNTIAIPDPAADDFQLVAQEPKGFTEVLVIASRTPLRRALQVLQDLARSRGISRGPLLADNPVDVLDGLLRDLDAGTRGTDRSEGSGETTQGRSHIDVSRVAAMSITFQVI